MLAHVHQWWMWGCGKPGEGCGGMTHGVRSRKPPFLGRKFRAMKQRKIVWSRSRGFSAVLVGVGLCFPAYPFVFSSGRLVPSIPFFVCGLPFFYGFCFRRGLLIQTGDLWLPLEQLVGGGHTCLYTCKFYCKPLRDAVFPSPLVFLQTQLWQ